MALFIFTNDLRAENNSTLTMAQKKYGNNLSYIILSSKQPNKRMTEFQSKCIYDLLKSLSGVNILCVSSVKEIQLEKSLKECYINIDPTSNPNKILKIKKLCKKNNVILNCGYIDHTILDFTKFKRPYLVYSNFYQTFNAEAKARAHAPILSSEELSQRSIALSILNLSKKFDSYGKTRNIFSIPTSKLSVYLNFGCVSMREVVYAFRKNTPFFKELMWREFYSQIIYFHPRLHNGEAFYKRRELDWKSSSFLKNWKKGTTGYPIVDASMRCLNQTGYLHNRCRMIVASFLIKDLKIDWRIGEAYFKKHLLDYHFASNNGGWQFISGTGVSSMRQSIKFSPWIQSKKYDSECIFIKQYIPDLEKIPIKDIHNWNTKYKKYPNCRYPSPILI